MRPSMGVLPCFLVLLVLVISSVNAKVRIAESDGWTFMSFDSGVIQNAVKCTAPDEVRKTRECIPDPTQVRLAYTRGVISLIPTYVDVVHNNPAAHKDFKVLFLGLGTGTIPRFLHHYWPTIEQQVIEIDAEVVSAVRSYIGLADSVTIHTQDALQFVGREASLNDKLRGTYDLIVHDAFTAFEPAATLNTVPFYAGLMKLLEGGRTGKGENGFIISNVWCIDRNYTRRIADMYASVFSYVRVFGPGVNANGEANCYLIAHTPKADKRTVICKDGKCKQPKAKKLKNKDKSPICSSTEVVTPAGVAIQSEISANFDIGVLIEGLHSDLLFTDDPKFC